MLNHPMWERALDRQQVLQECFRRVQGPNAAPTPEALLLAARVELGELLQKVKPRWAWWKRNDVAFTEDERAAVLEELADILHFVLGLAIVEPFSASRIVHVRPLGGSLVGLANQTFEAPAAPEFFAAIVGLAGELGFSERELFDTYMAKSLVNLRRWDAEECLERGVHRGKSRVTGRRSV